MRSAAKFLALAILLCAAVPLVFAEGAARVKDAYVTTGSGIRIHYLEAGSNTSQPALILIPGWRLPAYLWTEQLHAFAKSTRVVAIDPRSQGESTKTTDGNTPESRAADLHEVLGKLGLKRVVLVGWSQGGQDVAAYLQRYGTQSIAGVVFVDSPVAFGPAELDLHKEFARMIIAGTSVYAAHPAEYSEGMVKSLFKKPHPDLDLSRVVQATLKTPTDSGIAMIIADIFGADRRPALAQLDVPCLMIAASTSPLLDVQKELAASTKGAQLVVVEGAGHAVFVDDPEKFDDALATFLRSLPAK